MKSPLFILIVFVVTACTTPQPHGDISSSWSVDSLHALEQFLHSMYPAGQPPLRYRIASQNERGHRRNALKEAASLLANSGEDVLRFFIANRAGSFWQGQYRISERRLSIGPQCKEPAAPYFKISVSRDGPAGTYTVVVIHLGSQGDFVDWDFSIDTRRGTIDFVGQGMS